MEADMKTYTVYCHTSPSGRKYIGITSTHVNRRWGNGNGYKSNPYFWRAIQKYGWDNISHEILLDGLTVCEAKAKEEYLISTMNLTDRRFGYNIRGGGDGSFSEESRRKMSVARRGNKNCAGNILSSKTKQGQRSSNQESPGFSRGECQKASGGKQLDLDTGKWVKSKGGDAIRLRHTTEYMGKIRYAYILTDSLTLWKRGE